LDWIGLDQREQREEKHKERTHNERTEANDKDAVELALALGFKSGCAVAGLEARKRWRNIGRQERRGED